MDLILALVAIPVAILLFVFGCWFDARIEKGEAGCGCLLMILGAGLAIAAVIAIPMAIF